VILKSESKLSYDRRSVGLSVLVSGLYPGPATDLLSRHWKLSLNILVFLNMGRPLWLEDGLVIYSCCWVSPEQSVPGSPAGFIAILAISRKRVAQFYPRHWFWLINMLSYDIYIYVYTVHILGFCQSRIITVDYAVLKAASVKRHFCSTSPRHLLAEHQ
jgi:hypothetical protein